MNAHVIYSAAQETEFVELYDLDNGTPAAATKLNGTLPADGDVWDFRIIP